MKKEAMELLTFAFGELGVEIVDVGALLSAVGEAKPVSEAVLVEAVSGEADAQPLQPA
jgi:hypothetical protein